MNTKIRIFLGLLLLLLAVSPSYGDKEEKAKDNTIRHIRSEEEFRDIINKAGNRLLVFDLYADWCKPCKMLSPILEKIASEQREKADFYKINIDENENLATQFDVTGIPYVVFMKNGSTVNSIIGLRPKDTYVQIINKLFEPEDKQTKEKPDGKLVKGVRIIHIEPKAVPQDIRVYRGEKVQLIITNRNYSFAVQIPEFKISRRARKGKDLALTFKAAKVGAFPLFTNRNRLGNDRKKLATIIVMQYKPSEQNVVYEEISVKKAKELIGNKGILILDVRTSKEYHAGHLEGAKLIPVQQLLERISEIEDHKNRDVLVYCRSGNRSTAAAEILINNGFKKIYNMQNGIKGWTKKGFDTVK